MFIELLRLLDPNTLPIMLAKEHTLFWVKHNFIIKSLFIFSLSRTIHRIQLFEAFHRIRKHAVLERMVNLFYRRLTCRAFKKMNSLVISFGFVFVTKHSQMIQMNRLTFNIFGIKPYSI